MPVIANYVTQRGHLARLVQAQADSTAAFIVGRADYGKTWLMRWFEAEYASQARIVLLEMGDPSQTFTPILIMRACAQALGPEHFADFNTEAVRLTPARKAIIENVSVRGDHNSFVASTGETEEDQIVLALGLTESFVNGLKAAGREGPPIVLCFDGYAPAQTVVHRWFDLGFVRAVCALPGVRLIVTGRDIPQDGIPRKAPACASFALDGVLEAREWIRIAGDLGRRLPGDTAEKTETLIEGMILLTNGAPGQIMRWVQSQPANTPPTGLRK